MRALILCILAFFVVGCGSHSQEGKIQENYDKLLAQSSSRIVQTLDVPYLGGVPTKRGEQAEGLDMAVTLRRSGTIEQMCFALGSVLPMQVRVDSAIIPVKASAEGVTQVTPTKFDINYTGPLRGLLDQIASRSGTVWDYDRQGDVIIFAQLQVKTYTILAASGSVLYENNITNRSKDTSASASLGGMGSESGSESQTAQTNRSSFKADPLEDVETAVKAVLSPAGSVTANRASGSITVRDTVPVQRQVAILINEANGRMSRQVAVSVHVWALETSTDSKAGISISPAFANKSLALAGMPLELGSMGQLAATILDGKGKGTKGILEALYSNDKATLLTSGSGITMSNQPLPIQHVRKEAYLASVSTQDNDYGQTTTINPGEITHGFAMTVVPQILDLRRLILQYNISLSSLDGMEEYNADDIKIQLPKVSTKSFSQRVTMRMGQTLVLAGFAQSRLDTGSNLGLFSIAGSQKNERTIIVITIDVESVGEPLMTGLTIDVEREPLMTSGGSYVPA